MQQKVRYGKRRVVGLVCLVMGSMGWMAQSRVEQLKTGQAILGTETAMAPPVVRLMRVDQPAENTAVIVPLAQVQQDGEEAFVLTLRNQLAVRTKVEFEPWRGEYAKITAGLADQDVVVLDQVEAGQMVWGQMINGGSEAGQSGVMN
jgi:hypothetical protein